MTEYKGDKEKSARTAWAGLKQAGYDKGEDGKWTKKSDTVSLSQFSMTIVKASYEKSDNKMRFRAVASDTEKDLYGEAMTPELFKSFVDRIDKKAPIPEEFKSAICEDSWCGGMPYPSISHYRGGADGRNIPGKLESVYVDGNRLKSVGSLDDSDLGRAVFKSLCEDLYAKEKSITHDPVRISIGFLDLKHEHRGNGMNYVFERKSLTQACPMCARGIGNKYYLDGILVHEAFTRVPVNPRTEAEVEKSMTTKLEDAQGIIGKDLAALLEEKSIANDNVLIIKSDGTVERGITTMPSSSDTQADGKTMKLVGADVYNHCYDPNTGLFDQECIDEAMMGHMPTFRNAMKANDGRNKPQANPEVPANTVAKSKVMKKEADGEHPASHYLVAGDTGKPTTWHLRVKDASGKINTRLLGAAHAALNKGFRGNKYEGPDKGEALAKLHSLYNSAGMEWPDAKKEKSMAGNVKVPGNPEMVEPFDAIENELYPTEPPLEVNVDPEEDGDEGMGAPAGTYANVGKAKAKAYAGKETDQEEADEENVKGKKSMKEKAIVMTAKSLIGQVVKLKSQGVYGENGLQALQPYMDSLGLAVRRSMSGDGSAELAMLQQQISQQAQELAILKAQLSQGAVTNRSNTVPSPRSLTVAPYTADLMQKSVVPNQTTSLTPGANVQFAQIQNIARRSVGM